MEGSAIAYKNSGAFLPLLHENYVTTPQPFHKMILSKLLSFVLAGLECIQSAHMLWGQQRGRLGSMRLLLCSSSSQLMQCAKQLMNQSHKDASPLFELEISSVPPAMWETTKDTIKTFWGATALDLNFVDPRRSWKRFPPNFPLDLPAENQENSQTSFCRAPRDNSCVYFLSFLASIFLVSHPLPLYLGPLLSLFSLVVLSLPLPLSLSLSPLCSLFLSSSVTVFRMG